ncbi:MFS transporter [Polymorphospora lycopeni]|uniref:MFS transporter n=1 Tax=Polymorphospora lycopeni TaxID=3140240 RepID=A0ABV5CVC9_9ACTN
MTPPPTSLAVPAAPRVEPPPTAVAGPPADGSTGSGPAVRGGLVILVGILLVALNLRTAVTSLGALLDEVRVGLGASGAMAGLITTMPAIAFSVLGATTPWLVRRISPARLLAVAMAVLAAGQVLRVLTGNPYAFVVLTAVALAGVAIANILLPMLVKQYFPARAGLVTGAYSMSLTVGTATAAAAAVPVAHAFGSWRVGLGAWALLAAVALLPWLPAALRRTRPPAATGAAPTGRIRPARTRLGWAMALYFGVQSLGGYAAMGWLAQMFRDAGYSAQYAGLLLALVTAFGIPVALIMPSVATRPGALRPAVLLLSTAMAAGYLGLAFLPYEGALLWVALLAIGHGAFPLVLATIGLRARTAEGTVALSAFAQSTGYAIAALGPLLVGMLYAATGGWHLPIALLLVAVVVQTLAGLALARPRFLEDEPGAVAARPR